MPDDKNLTQDGFISANQDIDVTEIMDSIKKRIREKKDSGVLKQSEIDDILDMELLPLPDFLEVPNVYEPHLFPGDETGSPPQDDYRPMEIGVEDEGGSGLRGIVKKALLLTRKIFFPLIRFMSRPTYNELKQFTGDRYNDNARDIYRMKQEFERYKHVITHSREYIKLMHNAMNNMMVEFSKLKIDEELQKTKMKVLEDKIEFLENRERAIEKKLFGDGDGVVSESKWGTKGKKSGK
ncbi:MAG: hypothetical protein GY940_03225 [bacterium]|nr:hypothetical protein [bacterium]